MSKVKPIDQRVIEMYEAGHSLREIAAELSRSVRYPIWHLAKAGIETRPSHGHKFHKQWKGGRVQANQGYWRQQISADDPMASMRNHHGYVLEHRLIMARMLGRPLTAKETVHHINGDKADNRLENLQLRYGPHGKNTGARCRCCGSHDIEFIELK